MWGVNLLEGGGAPSVKVLLGPGRLGIQPASNPTQKLKINFSAGATPARP